MTEKGKQDGWSGSWPKDGGYKKPPRHTQFRPGQSGNPSGRPKKRPSESEILERVLSETIPIMEGGIRKRMSKKEVLIRNAVTRAFKDPRSLAQLLNMMHQVEKTKEVPFKVNAMNITLVDAPRQSAEESMSKGSNASRGQGAEIQPMPPKLKLV